MKRRKFIKSSLLLSASLTMPGWLAPTSAQPLATGAASRRSLFFPPERIGSLKTQLHSAADVQARWGRFIQAADALTPGGRRERSGPSMQTSLMLGLAWRVTGDIRYAEALRRSLLRWVASPWEDPQVAGRQPPWHSSLRTAGRLEACAAGRDALDDWLSVSDRKQITDGMMQLGILPILEDWLVPERRIHALDSMGHNWWSVCLSGAGVGVLAVLGEDIRAAGWLANIETALAGFFDYRGMVLLNKTANFDPKGAFYEGVNYAGYALESYLTFRLARVNAVAAPPVPIPLLEAVAEFFVHALYPASSGDCSVNFGDSALVSDLVPCMRLLGILGFSPELTRWYLQRQDRDSIAPLSFLHPNEENIVPGNTLPPSVIYPSVGWAMLRSSWENDATLLALKSGFTWNHAHADAGSFILFHAGRPLLIDSGRCNYGRPEYLDYYCQSRAHNVVLFNGEGQPREDSYDRGVKFTGQLHTLFDGLDLKYVYADATGPMARYYSRNYRHWLWVDAAILIFDDLRAYEAGRFDWLLHYAGTAEGADGTIRLSNGPARAIFSMLHPPNPVVVRETGPALDDPDKSVDYLRLSAPDLGREQKFISVILPESGASSPQVTLLSGPDALGVRISTGEQVTEVYLNLLSDGRRMHLNSNNVIDGWETDAYLFGLTHPAGGRAAIENVTRYFLVGCSYVRRDGHPVLDSLSKVNAVFRPGKNIEMLLDGQPRMAIGLHNSAKPATLCVNGKAVPFNYIDRSQTLFFQSDLA